MDNETENKILRAHYFLLGMLAYLTSAVSGLMNNWMGWVCCIIGGGICGFLASKAGNYAVVSNNKK